MQELINAAAHYEIRITGTVVQQVRRPLGDTARFAIYQQVVIDPGVQGQLGLQLQVDQMNECVATYRDDLALLIGQ
ncbi:hypothetical protein PsgRace4_09817 [Pseudomonas savastanoi pv. glycinea str. race 4]|nr:hypothetical protein PsgRace4_09817 [Pseudomonas savastanoi pv. glycinea str. race 4]